MIYLILFLEVMLGLVGFYLFYLAPKMNPVNRAKKFMVEGNFDEALLEFNRAVENEPDNHEVHFTLAELYLKKDVLIKAEEHYKRVLEINKFTQDIEKSDVLQKLGEIQFNLNKLEEAYHTFKNIVEIYASDYSANYYIGTIYAGQLMYEDAIGYYKKAIRSRPNDIKARMNAALCMVQVDHIENAIALFQETLKLAPDNKEIEFYLAVVLYMSKGYKKAIELFIAVIKTTSDDIKKFTSYRLSGISYFFQGKNDNFKEIYDAAIEFVKLNSMIDEYKQLLYDYSMVYILRNKWIEALEKLSILKAIDNYFGFIDELISYIDFRRGKEEAVQSEEEDMDFSPAIASYYKAAQHVMGIKDEDNQTEQYAKIFTEIKEEWTASFVLPNFLWKIGGLTSNRSFNLEIFSSKEKMNNITDEVKKITSLSSVKDFMKVDRRQFQQVCRKIVNKLGYTIIKENFKTDLADFVEGDGLDLVCRKTEDTGVITLIQIRRWDQGKVGEIPFRNMTNEMSNVKATKGIFIIPAELTPGAQRFTEKMSNIRVLTYSDLSRLLRSIMP
ncbi:MAG: tetratricopeptide repeat protein [Spirochaetes bacterium]|nr:tetratricopeptide repeat protein [Spirochaetota bacterium]